MGSLITVWLANNWLAILIFVITVYLSFALRPRPKIRYWIVGLGGSQGPYGPRGYRFGATCTRLFLRNVGSEPIDAKQWRVPLSIKFDTNTDIIKVVPTTSYSDIRISDEITRDEPQRILLRVSHLYHGDEVAFEIQHGETRHEPQLHGEVEGSRESLARGLTAQQRFIGLFSIGTVGFARNYIQIASIAWLIETRLNFFGILRDIIFLFASPLFLMVGAILFGRAGLERRPMVGSGVVIISFAAGVIAFCVAWSAGYRLWYPQVIAYWVVVLVLATVAAVPMWQVFAEVADPKARVPTEIMVFFAALVNTIFAVFVARSTGSSELLVGLACAFAFMLIRLDSERLRYSLAAALGLPGSRPLLPPPRE